MIALNHNLIETISKSANAKTTQGKENTSLYPLFSNSLTNLTDISREFSTYEMAHWINNTDRWIHNRQYNNTCGYKRGSLLFIDLGSTNYRYEPSFAHPCVVLAETRNFILIVPCSSKKYASGFPEIIDATPSDGFTCNTGIQTNSFRWVSKNRVISKLGVVSSNILDKIDTALLKLIPSYKRAILQKDSEIARLTAELTTLKDALQGAEEKIAALKLELTKDSI